MTISLTAVIIIELAVNGSPQISYPLQFRSPPEEKTELTKRALYTGQTHTKLNNLFSKAKTLTRQGF